MNAAREMPPRLRGALKAEAINRAEGADSRVVDCLEDTAAATFYAELFNEKLEQERRESREAARKADAPPGDRRKSDDRPADPEWVEIVEFLTHALPPDALVIELGGGVYQRRSGFMYRHFENYFPLDISRTSVARYAARYERWGIAGDATRLPFKDASVDCVFSRTFLEHVPEPGHVLAEVARVLRPGGIVLHDDAWFCRWWSRFGVVGLKRFANMSLKERLIWLGSRITEFSALRMPRIVVPRLFRELLVSRKKPLELPFGRLKPNYDLHLGCDEDAAASIDPLDVVRFYESRGFRLVSPLTFTQRILLRNTHVILRRDGSGRE